MPTQTTDTKETTPEPPRITWEDLNKLPQKYQIHTSTEVVTVGDLRKGDWVRDDENNIQPILHLFPIHVPARQFEIQLITGAKGKYGDTHLIKYTMETDRHLFHERLKHSRRALKQLSRKSISVLEYMADLPSDKNPPCTAHNLFMALSPHTWGSALSWNGANDTADIANLRVTINRLLEAIGPIVEDTINYRDFAAMFFPETLEAEENPLETSTTEVVRRYDTQKAAQQLLLLLNTRKYAKKYAKKLPWYWYMNPGRYNYGGIEIGHIVTAEELYELSKQLKEAETNDKEADNSLVDIELPN